MGEVIAMKVSMSGFLFQTERSLRSYSGGLNPNGVKDFGRQSVVQQLGDWQEKWRFDAPWSHCDISFLQNFHVASKTRAHLWEGRCALLAVLVSDEQTHHFGSGRTWKGQISVSKWNEHSDQTLKVRFLNGQKYWEES